MCSPKSTFKNLNRRNGSMYKHVSGEDGLHKLESAFAGLTTGRISCVVQDPKGPYGFARGRFNGDALLNHRGLTSHDMTRLNIPLPDTDDFLRENQVVVGYHRTSDGNSYFLRWYPVCKWVANFVDMVKSGYQVGEVKHLVLPSYQSIFHSRWLQWVACATLLYSHGFVEEAVMIAIEGRSQFNAEETDRVIRNICRTYNHDFWDRFVLKVDEGGIHSSIVPPAKERDSNEFRKGVNAMGRPTAVNHFKSGELDKIKLA